MKKTVAAVAVLVAMVIIVFGVSAFNKNDQSSSTVSDGAAIATAESANKSTAATKQTTTPQPAALGSETLAPSPTPAPTPQSTTTSYQDGSYTATGTYNTPGGKESITVSVVLASDKITSTAAQSNAKSGESKEFQSDFISGYKSQITGKSLDAVSLSKVSGSSLTPKGFNDAIEQIKNKARS